MNEKRQSPQQMTVGQLLSQVCRMTGHRVRGHMEKIGLHRGQGFALIHLWHHDGMAQRELSQFMHISPASVTNMLQRMERDGWIERRRDAVDQRVVRVFASEKAKKLSLEAKRVFKEMEDDLNSVFTPEEQDTLRKLLMKLHERFTPGEPHPMPPCFEEDDEIDERTPKHGEVSMSRGPVSADTSDHEKASA
ncbi:MarR family transcriptional regulator [Candidatus Bipolaricaulota bacterium]|nr:MarR family transcriptional regulator [Candidatus Bipolaricaulota bacterium]TFH08855.1 MAG: MarR family transcriptional regulator [Candidatus Atribacteria bacterium]